MTTCSDCNKKCNRTVYLLKYQNRVCTDCLDSNYQTCEDCGKKTLIDDVIHIKDEDKYICSDCVDDYSSCDNCGNYNRNTYELHDGDAICDECRDNGDYSRCDDCDDLFHVDDLNYHDHDDCYYCDNCREDHDDDEYGDDDAGLFNYHSNKGRDNLSNDERFRIGFELEREDHDVAIKLDVYKILSETGWVIESDGSLGYGGFEAISPILPLNIEKLTEVFKNKTINTLANAKYTSHCGGHITVSDIKRTSERLINDTWGYYPVIYALYPKRVNNSYCCTTNDKNRYAGKDIKRDIDGRSRRRWEREQTDLGIIKRYNDSIDYNSIERIKEWAVSNERRSKLLGITAETTELKPIKEPVFKEYRFKERVRFVGGGHHAVSSRARGVDSLGAGVEFRIFDAPKNEEDIIFRARILKFMLENPALTVIDALKYMSDNKEFNKLLRDYTKFLEMTTEQFTDNIVKFSNEIQKETVNAKEVVKLKEVITN